MSGLFPGRAVNGIDFIANDSIHKASGVARLHIILNNISHSLQWLNGD